METTTLTQKSKTYKPETQKLSTEHLIQYSKKLLANDFQLPGHTKVLYQIISEYINKSPDFEKRVLKTSKKDIPFSLKKGLFLISRPGTGKSFIFEELLKQFFPYYPQFSYRTLTVYKLEQLYAEHGTAGWQHVNDGIYTNQKIFNLYIDDIGRETDRLLHYGNVIDFIDRFIDIRARQQRQYSVVTHASSNLSLPELKERYSAPTFSRMFKLFNFIVFDAKDDFRMI